MLYFFPVFKKLFNYWYWFRREIFIPYNPARIYDDLIKKSKYEETIDYKKRVESFADILKRLQLKPRRVLDLATGTGAFIDALPHKKKAEILGVDVSENMLNVAKNRFASFKNVALKKTDFTALKFLPETFDLIAITYATRFIPHKFEKKIMQHIANWLTKKGVFIAVLNASKWEKLIIFLSRLTGLPRGYNMPMNWTSYFTDITKPYLKLHKKYKLKQRYPFVDNILLVFGKRL